MTQTYDTELKLFINGSWRTGEGRDEHAVVNPAPGDAIAAVPLATAADLDEALAASERGFVTWRAMDVEARGAILHKVASLIRERTGCTASVGVAHGRVTSPWATRRRRPSEGSGMAPV